MAEVEDFREFVRQRTPALSRGAYLLTGDHQLAEDLLQGALAASYRHWRRIRDGNPEAYVRQTMYHQHVAWWRRRRVTEQLSAAPAERGSDDPADAAALRLTVAAALRRLTPRQRAVILLRYYDDLTESQAADVLGCRIGTVKRHAHEALRKLREFAPELLAETREGSAR